MSRKLLVLCLALVSLCAGCPQNDGGIIGNGASTSPTTLRPVAIDPGRIYAYEDTPVSITLTGSFAKIASKGSDASLQVLVTSLPAFGMLSVQSGPAPLQITYTPGPDYSGPDSLTFLVSDAKSNRSEPVSVDIRVLAVNDPPVGVPPAPVTTRFDTSVAIVVSGTDPDAPEASLFIEIVGGTAHGLINRYVGYAPMTLIYTPDPGYYGTDGFDFIVHDFQGGTSGVASASIEVTAPSFPLGLVMVSPMKTVQEGACSTVNEVEVQDTEGRTVKMPAHVTLEFGGPESASFYADEECAVPVSFLIIERGSAGAVFYFLDTQAGEPEYSVSDAAEVLLPAAQSHVITAAPMTSSLKDAGAGSAAPQEEGQSPRHACLIVKGSLYCRGANEYGQLGDGTTEDHREAVLVGEDGWTSVTVEIDQTCGTRKSRLYCWGRYFGPLPRLVP
ncbi:MAG: hypothetical protein KDH09_06150 [Chrysiogenetes bacterium]|nr:hypothetical protein [Chrysiogenetes bacterium]